MKKSNIILYFYYAVSGFLASIAVLTAFLEETTPDDPTGNAGFYGAFVVLCITSIIGLESLRSSSSLRQRLMAGGIGIGLLAGAYLLLAESAMLHPTSLELLRGIAFVWLLSAAIVLIFFMVVLFTQLGKTNDDNQK